MVGSGGQRAAERPPPFVPAVTKAGELREEAVAGRCGGRRGREEAKALVVEVEVRRPEHALELACAPVRPGGRARGHLAASAAPRRQRFASLEREDAFLHRGWPPRQNACLVASSVGGRFSSEKHYAECIFAFAWRC